MTKKEKLRQRVIIARDVLAQISSGKTIPQAGVTVDDALLERMLKTDDIMDPERFQGYLKNRRCGACAKGSIFLAWIRRHDGLDSYKAWHMLMEMWDGDKEGSLKRAFGATNLRYLEAAFEGFDWAMNKWPWLKNERPKDRLVIMMKHLIKTGGEEFIPPRPKNPLWKLS